MRQKRNEAIVTLTHINVVIDVLYLDLNLLKSISEFVMKEMFAKKLFNFTVF
jgi:hypothetical protein